MYCSLAEIWDFKDANFHSMSLRHAFFYIKSTKPYCSLLLPNFSILSLKINELKLSWMRKCETSTGWSVETFKPGLSGSALNEDCVRLRNTFQRLALQSSAKLWFYSIFMEYNSKTTRQMKKIIDTLLVDL
jgi:hypothetical protein